MSIKSRTASLAALVFCLATTATAVPTGLGTKDVRRSLSPRMEVNFVDCTSDQKTKLDTDFADAAALANIAYDKITTSSTAFTHYLRTEDLDRAKDWWSMVAANNDPTNAPYTFSVRCGSCDSDSTSLAITDAQAQDGDTPREMLICPLYFTSSSTTNNLASKTYDDGKRGSWCQTGQKFKDFETGGHTLLHEMTHLDALGAAANMPVYNGVHGTDDVSADDFGDDYTTAARNFLDTWVNHPDDLADGALQPFQNAENIAASATENWFLSSCSNTFTNIDL